MIYVDANLKELTLFDPILENVDKWVKKLDIRPRMLQQGVMLHFSGFKIFAIGGDQNPEDRKCRYHSLKFIHSVLFYGIEHFERKMLF